MITAQQLRDWARRINAGGMNDLMDLADELHALAAEIDVLTTSNEWVLDEQLTPEIEIPAGALTYPQVPKFLSAARWPIEDFTEAWFVIGPADALVGVDTVDVMRYDGTPATIVPGDIVGWRKVRRKGRGSVLYLVMTFDGFDLAREADVPEWTTG